MSKSSEESRTFKVNNTTTITHPRTSNTTSGLKLLRTGDVMPQIGLGTWLADPGVVENVVQKVLSDLEYLHIDAAWVYMNEDEVGSGMQEAFKSGKISRKDVFLTTKLWNNMHKHEDVLECCKQSLKSLKTEYLDLYLIHFPVSFKKDVTYAKKSTDVIENDLRVTWKAMENLVDLGLAKNIGVSNFEIHHLQYLLTMPDLKYKPQVNQLEIHPYYQRNDIVRYCQQRGIIITAHSSLGGSGNPWIDQRKWKLLEDPVITNVASQVERTNGQVLLKWALQKGISVIPKSVNDGRLAQNHDLSGFELTNDQMSAINDLDRGDFGRVCHPSTPWLGYALFDDELEEFKKL